jgi:hypothetical protein
VTKSLVMQTKEVEFLKGEPDRNKMLDAMKKDALFLRKLVSNAS